MSTISLIIILALLGLLILAYSKYNQLEQDLKRTKQELRKEEEYEETLRERIHEAKREVENYNAILIKMQSSYELEIDASYSRGEKHGRADALKKSKAVAHGFSAENFAPLLHEHWNHRDFRHMGDPIDYLVFAGIDDVRQTGAKSSIEEIVLLDIKTGGSQLSTIQRRIRDAVSEGRVRFATYNVDTQELRTWPPYMTNQLEFKWKK
jgi:predicted Holliday junction resolvase-like endonuclease